MTSHGYPPQPSHLPDTHYTEEFHAKMNRPTTPLRPGSASGNRANNPHPPQVLTISNDADILQTKFVWLTLYS